MGVGEGLLRPRGGFGGRPNQKLHTVCAQEELGVGKTKFLWVWVRASRGQEEG